MQKRDAPLGVDFNNMYTLAHPSNEPPLTMLSTIQNIIRMICPNLYLSFIRFLGPTYGLQIAKYPAYCMRLFRVVNMRTSWLEYTKYGICYADAWIYTIIVGNLGSCLYYR